MTVQNHCFRLVWKLPLFTLLLALLALPSLALTDSVIIEDRISTDDTIQENLTVTLVQNTLSELEFTLPPGASNIQLEKKPMVPVNGTITIPLNCSICRFTLSYSFKGAITGGTQYHEYSRTLDFPSTPATLSYSVHLPPGHGVTPRKDEPSVVPTPAKLETDGKQITILWVEEQPELPKRYYVAYGDLETLTFSLQDFSDELAEWPVWILLFLALIIGAAAGIFIQRRLSMRQADAALPAVPSSLLTPDEHILVKAVQKAGNGVSQKELGKELAWSKSKVSAIVTGLEYKQLLEREKHGRQRKITLLKHVETKE